MSFEYIEQTYRKRFFKGQIVRALGKLGTVDRATNHVYVKLQGQKHAGPYHPSDVDPVEEAV